MMKMRYRDEKDMSGCAISGIMSEEGKLFSGDDIIASIEVMHDRSSGLGGGFAAYGIYPDFADNYALHIMFDDADAKLSFEQYLGERFMVLHDEPVPTRHVEIIGSGPIIHRYFVDILPELKSRFYNDTDDDIIVRVVMHVNANIDGTFVMSSGKNMGIFKGVGYPEDIGRYFRLEEYNAYLWLAHGRFPTNTTGWWGGAHPFGLLDWAVVHNGEISSYGINRRYLMNFGYNCALRTDTEVIAYMADLLMRKQGLPLELACKAMAPPFWKAIERMEPEEQELMRTLRAVYGGALLNGPFSIVIGHKGGMIGLNDRTKLRPMVAARKDDRLFMSSEESAIRVVCENPDKVWHAKGGVPIVGKLKEVAHA